MKKVMKKLIPAILIGVLAVSLTACGGNSGGSGSGGGSSSGGSGSKLTTYTFDGFTAQLPKGDVDDMEGFVAYYYNDNFMMSALKEDAETFAGYNANIDDYTLEDYAEMVEYANGVEDSFELDEKGNLSITYQREAEGRNFFYYSTVKQGTQSFWVITFACFDGEEGTYLPQFKEYASLLEFD